MARRPSRTRNLGTAAPAQAPASEPKKTRDLPEDPVQRQAALATVKDEVSLCLGLADIVAARLPPNRPLSPEEKESIAGPLAQVLYKYGGSIPCEWQLAIATGFVAAGRYAEYKTSKAAQLAIPGVNP